VLFVDLVYSALLLWYFGSIPGLFRRGLGGALNAFGLGCVLTLMCWFIPVLLLNTVLLGVVTGVCLAAGVTRRTFWTASLTATGCAYLAASYFVAAELLEREAIRTRYPLESMAERLAREPERAEGAAKPFASDRLGAIESEIDKEMSRFETVSRRDMLMKLHQNLVRQFIGSPGFGIMRDLRNQAPSETSIELYSGEREFSDTPPGMDTASPAEVEAPARTFTPVQTATPEREALFAAHSSTLVDFANVRGFGYVRDRDHVAGFRPHGIRDSRREAFPVPVDSSPWRIGRLELVSLLKFDEPRVYVSPRLPRMGRLGDGRTRPADGFELAALAALLGGEELYTGKADDELCVLGAIRAGKQCLACHSAERGELLGAFTYRLRPAETLPRRDDTGVAPGEVPTR
jgi:hypothetical protein